MSVAILFACLPNYVLLVNLVKFSFLFFLFLLLPFLVNKDFHNMVCQSYCKMPYSVGLYLSQSAAPTVLAGASPAHGSSPTVNGPAATLRCLSLLVVSIEESVTHCTADCERQTHTDTVFYIAYEAAQRKCYCGAAIFYLPPT